MNNTITQSPIFKKFVIAEAFDLFLALDSEMLEAFEYTRDKPTYRPGIGKNKVSGLIIPFKKTDIIKDENIAESVIPSLI